MIDSTKTMKPKPRDCWDCCVLKEVGWAWCNHWSDVCDLFKMISSTSCDKGALDETHTGQNSK